MRFRDLHIAFEHRFADGGSVIGDRVDIEPIHKCLTAHALDLAKTDHYRFKHFLLTVNLFCIGNGQLAVCG